ncbi:TPA: MamI family restriction endonuclease [Staphylococcus aureus]|nr:MamI family restriction endonuclease [Staphylococcus aureus]
MIFDIQYAKKIIESKFDDTSLERSDIDDIVTDLVKTLKVSSLTVEDRVSTSRIFLEALSTEDRKNLCKKMIEEQVLEQREKLHSWSTITGQGSQIDTGYIAQHLISIITQIPGQGMRGKGDDLIDGSEIKSANFLDSLDKKGATAPRWNFTAITEEIVYNFLKYKKIYLVSFDTNEHSRLRFRVWEVLPNEHELLKNRYNEWIDTKAKPKFLNTNARASVNFQLFPPRNGKNENFARHGNGFSNGFSKIEIPLENVKGAKKIFHAEQNSENDIEILTFN